MGLFTRHRNEPHGGVQIIDLPDRHVGAYLTCLEEWSDEMKEAGDHKARWYEQASERGLRVKVAVNDDDQVLGMIQYVPIDLSPAEGSDLYMILCVWVHGYDEGVGDVQGWGIGSALLEAAEDDARHLGAKGMAAWGLALPVWMRAGWFKKHGYRTADRQNVRTLVWKRFTDDAEPPRWIEPKPVPVAAPGEVDVIAYKCGWCPGSNITYERAKRAADEFDDVTFTTVDTSDRETLLACGHCDEVFVNGRRLQKGAPPSYDKIRRMIDKQRRR